MPSRKTDRLLCCWDTITRRCNRCGYVAKEIPFYRACRTLGEEARELVEHHATNRIVVPPLPLGDAAAAILKSIGVTKERLKAATGKDCGCAGRQSKMNQIGASVSAFVSNTANGLLNTVLPYPVSTDEVAAVANAMAKNPATNPGLIALPPAATKTHGNSGVDG